MFRKDISLDFLNFLELINKFLSWRLLIPVTFISFAFLGLDFVPIFHDILHAMFNYIVVSCILFSLLVICKIGFLLQELIARTIKLKREESNNLNSLLSLSKPEIAVLKYLFYRQTNSAWLPPDFTEAILLLHKGYLEVVSEKRKSFDALNFYLNEKDTLYKLSEATLHLINKHKEEITRKWKKIRINKRLEQYQK